MRTQTLEQMRTQMPTKRRTQMRIQPEQMNLLGQRTLQAWSAPASLHYQVSTQLMIWCGSVKTLSFNLKILLLQKQPFPSKKLWCLPRRVQEKCPSVSKIQKINKILNTSRCVKDVSRCVRVRHVSKTDMGCRGKCPCFVGVCVCVIIIIEP